MINDAVFLIRGHEVSVSALSTKELPEGGLVVTIDCACLNREGGVSHQSHTSTFFGQDREQRIVEWMKGAADWLEKLLWGDPKIAMYVGQLVRPNGQVANLTFQIDIRHQWTVIGPELVEVFELPRTGTFRPLEDPKAEVPVHRATFKFGKKSLTVDVLSVDLGTNMIGSDLILKALNNDPTYLFDAFSSDTVRALLNAARAKQKTVLLLGSYGDPGARRLQIIRDTAEAAGYEAVLLSDFPDIPEQSVVQKMLLFGCFARFVLCDESQASGHLVELEACADAEFVTALLRPQGKAPTWMNEDIALGRDYMKVFAYDCEADLQTAVSSAMAWAKVKVTELSKHYDENYAWRKSNRHLAI